MFFDKPFHDLTFNDVVQFCRRQLPEGKQLDYKYMLPKNHEKFAKTIASFANAMGGTIIVGVQDDKNDKPRPPFLGIPYHEKMRNSIEDIIQVYIDPIVFVDINICVNDRGDRMFVLINIPQSNLTPHLVGKSKRAYIRTGQSSRPEAIVHPEKLPWLLDHRRKSERLRHILYDKAESHFDNYLKTMNLSADGQTACTMSVIPLYPEEPLTDYKHLPDMIKASSAKAPYGIMADPAFPLQPVQDGAAVISNKRGVYRMTEFNSYGLVMRKQIITQEEIVNGHAAKTVRLESLGQTLTLFLQTARKKLAPVILRAALIPAENEQYPRPAGAAGPTAGHRAGRLPAHGQEPLAGGAGHQTARHLGKHPARSGVVAWAAGGRKPNPRVIAPIPQGGPIRWARFSFPRIPASARTASTFRAFATGWGRPKNRPNPCACALPKTPKEAE